MRGAVEVTGNGRASGQDERRRAAIPTGREAGQAREAERCGSENGGRNLKQYSRYAGHARGDRHRLRRRAHIAVPSSFDADAGVAYSRSGTRNRLATMPRRRGRHGTHSDLVVRENGRHPRRRGRDKFDMAQRACRAVGLACRSDRQRHRCAWLNRHGACRSRRWGRSPHHHGGIRARPLRSSPFSAPTPTPGPGDTAPIATPFTPGRQPARFVPRRRPLTRSFDAT